MSNLASIGSYVFAAEPPNKNSKQQSRR